MNALPGKPWIVLIVDDDDSVHEVTTLALRRARFFGLPVKLQGARSKREALEILGDLDSERTAVALVDVVMEHDTAGLELVEALRARFGSPLQIVMRTGQPGVMAPEEVISRFDISNYIAKTEATPERLRTAVGLGIRNFRTQSAMQVLCESLATFTALFETATTTVALDQILDKALSQYGTVWGFDFLFVANTQDGHDNNETAPAPWHNAALQQIRSLDLNSHRSVSFSQLARDTWGCSVKPLGGRFSAAFALRQSDPPSEILLRELHTLLRTWALARESVQLKQIAAHEQKVRSEMHRERSDAIAQMVAGVAHEVNTPLGVANSAASTLSELVARPHFKALADKEEFADDLEDLAMATRLIQRNIARADELIRSFRKLSVRQLVDQREEVDFLSCIEDAIKLYSPKAKRSGLQVNIKNQLPKNPPKWLGYPGHLAQVLTNLIANADRYAYGEGGEGGGAVDVFVSCIDGTDGPEFRIVVRDYGKGIPKENLPLIFEAFFTTGRSLGGTGLGLSIVRNIVESVFGGTVTCESKLGGGTAFKIAFTHCKEQQQKEQQAEDTTDRSKIFQEFVELQEKLVRDGELGADDQLRMTELRAQVESFLAVQFKSEQRRHPRVPCRRNAILAEPELAGVEIRMLDLSEGGAQLLFPIEVQLGQPFTLVRVDDTPLPIKLEVVTVSRFDGDADGARWQAGVRFVDLGVVESRAVKLLLVQLMLEYWR